MMKPARFIALLCTLACLPTSAFAGQTPWIEIGPDTQIRLISSDTIIDGATHAAIEIDMPEKTKTYWRIPGETGIPLVLDASASKGVTNAEVLWPYPERQSTGGYIDFVYHGHTVLPLKVDVNADDPELTAQLLLGVCDEICVPVRVSLSLNLAAGRPDAAQAFRIKQAMSGVPQVWAGEPAPIGAVKLHKSTGQVSVAYKPGGVDPASIIVDTGKPADLFGLPQKSPESEIVVFEILDSDATDRLDGVPVTVTFVTSDGVFELKRSVQTRIQ